MPGTPSASEVGQGQAPGADGVDRVEEATQRHDGPGRARLRSLFIRKHGRSRGFAGPGQHPPDERVGHAEIVARVAQCGPVYG